MYDNNPAVPDAERYKLFGGFGKPLTTKAGGTFYYMAGPDGIHFPSAPVPMVHGVNNSIRADCLPDFHFDVAHRLGFRV